MGGVWGGTVDCTLLILFFFFHSVYMQAFCMGGGEIDGRFLNCF